MAASSLELREQLAEFDEQVRLNTLHAVCGRPFVNTARLKAGWLSAQRIDTFLRIIWDKDVNPQDTGAKIWKESFRVFCIVASFGQPELIQIFNELNCTDTSLPEYHQSSLEGRLRVAGCRDASDVARRFVESQWTFCAWEFGHGDSNKRHLEHRILPITRQEPIRRGGTAELHQIEVPEEFLDQSLKDAFPRSSYHYEGKGKYYRFALKVFQHTGFADYHNEQKAFNALREHNGFVRCLGTFLWRSKHFRSGGEQSITMDSAQLITTYNILLEYGVSDLEVYFTTRHPPFFAGEIHQFWEQLFDLASALEKLHNLKPENGSRYQVWSGWHADIKPANILLIEDKFRLADPGFAQFVADGVVQEATAVMRGGTVAYGAPELPRRGHKRKAVTQKIDIWSLGCVFSVAATWVVGGHPAVAQFKQIRKDAVKQLGTSGDWFHDGQKVLDAILEWHQILRDSLRSSDLTTGKVLELIERTMLVGDPQQRRNAKELCEDLQSIVESSRPPKYPLTSTTKAIMQSLQSVDDESPDRPSKSYSSDTEKEQQSTSHQKERQRLLDVTVKKTAFRSEYLSQKIDGSKDTPTPASPAAIGFGNPPDANGSERTPLRHGHRHFPSIDTALGDHPSAKTPEPIGQNGQGLSPVSIDETLTVRRVPKGRPHEHLSVFQARDILERKYNKATLSGIKNLIRKKNHQDGILQSYYDNRDIRFLIDNSGSMRRHWPQVKFVATTLVWYCSGQDDDGVELNFSCPNKITRRIDHGELSRLMEDKNNQPVNGVKTQMVSCLQKIFGQLLQEYKRKKKNISLIILTDGKWDAMDEENGQNTLESIKSAIAGFIREITQRVGTNMPCPIGIQFVQFGNDVFATENLRSLDNDLCIEKQIPDVIDLEPADGGDVNKMLLGNFVPEYDFADVDDDSIFARFRAQSPDSAISPTSPAYSKLASEQTDCPWT